MRCSFHRKKHPQGHLFNCQAFLYATIVNNKLVLKKLNPYHSHQLLTSEDIKLQLKQSRKSIPESIKAEAYKLFISGESCKDIFNLIKKSHYSNSNCPFAFDPLKNYLYDQNKNESVDYENISQIYKKLKEENDITKSLLMETLGEESGLKALAFTFQEQVNYGNLFNYEILFLF